MKPSTAISTAAVAGILAVAGTAAYTIAKDKIKLFAVSRKRQQAQDKLDALNEQLANPTGRLIVRFEAL